MRKILLLIAIYLSFSLMSQAQNGSKENRIKSLEIAYITKELNLTPQEAQRFWPIYNKYAEEMRSSIRNSQDSDDVLARQQELLNIRKKYRSEFLKVLSQDRVNHLYTAENKFRDMIRRELQQRQLQNQQLNPRKRGG